MASRESYPRSPTLSAAFRLKQSVGQGFSQWIKHQQAQRAQRAQSVSVLMDLSDDLQRHVISYLDLTDLATLALVNQHLHRLSIPILYTKVSTSAVTRNLDRMLGIARGPHAQHVKVIEWRISKDRRKTQRSEEIYSVDTSWSSESLHIVDFAPLDHQSHGKESWQQCRCTIQDSAACETAKQVHNALEIAFRAFTSLRNVIIRGSSSGFYVVALDAAVGNAPTISQCYFISVIECHVRTITSALLKARSPCTQILSPVVAFEPFLFTTDAEEPFGDKTVISAVLAVEKMTNPTQNRTDLRTVSASQQNFRRNPGDRYLTERGYSNHPGRKYSDKIAAESSGWWDDSDDEISEDLDYHKTLIRYNSFDDLDDWGSQTLNYMGQAEVYREEEERNIYERYDPRLDTGGRKRTQPRPRSLMQGSLNHVDEILEKHDRTITWTSLQSAILRHTEGRELSQEPDESNLFSQRWRSSDGSRLYCVVAVASDTSRIERAFTQRGWQLEIQQHFGTNIEAHSDQNSDWARWVETCRRIAKEIRTMAYEPQKWIIGEDDSIRILKDVEFNL